MDFGYSDEQQLLLESIDDFFEQNPQFNEQYIRECETAHLPLTEYNQAFLDAGFGSMGIPEQYGGTEVDMQTICAMAMHVNKHGFPANVGNVLQIGDILAFGSEEQKADIMDCFLNNKKGFSLALSEPQAGSDSNAITTSYERKDGKIVINGHKAFTTDGDRAKYILVMARDFSIDEKPYKSMSCFLVPTDAPGVTFEPLHKLGELRSSCCETYFENVVIDENAMVGPEHQGFLVVMKNFELERLVIAAECVGRAECAYGDALVYATQREQFGKKIGQFQLVEEMLVNMRIKIDNMRNSVLKTAWEYDNKQSIKVSAALSKLYCARSSQEVIDDAMQILGGIGYMDDHRVTRLWRAARMYRIAGGTDQIMIYVAGKDIQKEVTR